VGDAGDGDCDISGRPQPEDVGGGGEPRGPDHARMGGEVQGDLSLLARGKEKVCPDHCSRLAQTKEGGGFTKQKMTVVNLGGSK